MLYQAVKNLEAARDLLTTEDPDIAKLITKKTLLELVELALSEVGDADRDFDILERDNSDLRDEINDKDNHIEDLELQISELENK